MNKEWWNKLYALLIEKDNNICHRDVLELIRELAWEVEESKERIDKIE